MKIEDILRVIGGDEREYGGKIALLRIGERYFVRYGAGGRVLTAWSASGGGHYYPYSIKMLRDYVSLLEGGKCPKIVMLSEVPEKDDSPKEVDRLIANRDYVEGIAIDFRAEKARMLADFEGIESIALSPDLEDDDKIGRILSICEEYTKIPF
jgi:hypothetical protein